MYRAGKSVANRYIVLYYFDRDPEEDVASAEGPRVGFSVSKRVGGAVERNSVKRALREAYGCWSGGSLDCMDLVFVARPSIVALLTEGGFAAVKEKMTEVLSKASLSRSTEEGRDTR